MKDPQAQRDARTLLAVLEHPAFDDLQFDGGSPRAIFEGWADRLKSNGESRPLSEKQRAWAEGVARRLDIDLGATNLISSGVVKVRPKERERFDAFIGSLVRPTLPPHKRCFAQPACSKPKGHVGECS